MKVLSIILIVVVLCAILMLGIHKAKNNQIADSTSSSFKLVEVTSDEEAEKLEREANEMKEKSGEIDYEVEESSAE